jgi:hypothetical protein
MEGNEYNEEDFKNVVSLILRFCYKVSAKMKKYRSRVDLFLNREYSWLDKQIKVIRESPKSTPPKDGNTVRRFFKEFDKSSQITGINKDLIYRFGVILSALSSGFEINTERFDNYCTETANLYDRIWMVFYVRY